jgi:predicted ATPase
MSNTSISPNGIRIMHRFIDFKGFANTELNLFQPLTVLIGPNGSGKSNVIEAVELLSFIAQGKPLYEITDVVKGESSFAIRGGLLSCPRYGKDSFTLQFSAGTRFEGKVRTITYSVSVQVKPAIKFSEESLVFEDGVFIFRTIPSSHAYSSSDITVECNNFARGGKKPQKRISGSFSALSQYKRFALDMNKNKYESYLILIDLLLDYLRSSLVFDPNPKLMRTYERIGDNILLKNGSNLSAVLFFLSKQNDKNGSSLSKMLEWINQLPEEPYDRFGFVETKLNDVIFGLMNKQGEMTDARLLSDGTLRCLAVLTALHTAKKRSRIIIEEFDNGLHPSRVGILIQALSYYCKKNKLNVLVTTHNPATLNALEDEQLKGVVLCVYDEKDNAFKLVKLQDITRYDELIERGRLGDLITRRIVEKYLSTNFEEEKKQKALEWLGSLK